MAYPFLLKKMLVRSGLASWLPSIRRRLDGVSAYLRHCSDRVLATPLGDLETIARCLEPQGPDVIDLGQGAPRFDILPTVSAKLPVDRRDWPPFAGLPELRAAVAEKLFTECQLAFDPLGEVLITAGAMGALQTVFEAFVNPGDGIVLLDPTSPLYVLLCHARRAKIRWLDSWVEEGRTRFRLDKLAAALRGARLIIINSPVNPSAGAIATEDLEQIAWWADKRSVLIVSDEVFAAYQKDGEPTSIGSFTRAQRRTLTVGSVSKSHALAAARVGWLAATRQLLRPCLAAAALGNPFVPTLAQQMALTALRVSRDSFRSIYASIHSRRCYAFDRLRALDINVAWPAGSFFLWTPVWEFGLSGREFAAKLLDEQRVRVIPGDLFGPGGAGHVRLSVAAEDGRLQEGLNRIAAFVQQFRAGPRAELAKAA